MCHSQCGPGKVHGLQRHLIHQLLCHKMYCVCKASLSYIFILQHPALTILQNNDALLISLSVARQLFIWTDSFNINIYYWSRWGIGCNNSGPRCSRQDLKSPSLTLATWMLSRVCYFLEGKTSGTMCKSFPEENAPLNLYTNLNAGVHLEVWLACIF